MEGDKNSSRVTSERVVENSSQDVSTFVVVGGRVGIVMLADTTPGTTTDGAGDEPSRNWKLKRGEVSSGVVTEEEDGDGGGTMIG